jgi:hypothetical protein
LIYQSFFQKHLKVLNGRREEIYEVELSEFDALQISGKM